MLSGGACVSVSVPAFRVGVGVIDRMACAARKGLTARRSSGNRRAADIGSVDSEDMLDTNRIEDNGDDEGIDEEPLVPPPRRGLPVLQRPPATTGNGDRVGRAAWLPESTYACQQQTLW